jgi:DNA-binding CsgD family transcriptional regulator/sugar-specific transcriptional regulator TrmB
MTAAHHAGLASLGLDPVTERAYRALLSRPSWPPEELAGRLGFADDEFAASLRRLVELRLVRRCADGDLRAVSPGIGLAALVASREAELADRRWELEQSRLAAAALTLERGVDTGAPPAVVTSDVVYGETAVRQRVTALLAEAERVVLAMSLSSSGYLDPVALPPPAARVAVRRGVTVRSVFFDRVRSDPRLAGYLDELAAGGAFVRTARRLPTSALVVDDRIVLLPVVLSMTGSRPGVVLLRLPSVVTATAELFERVWAGAAPVAGDGLDGAPDGQRDRELLGLLLAGCTDELAAERLNVSDRTVRRMVTGLLKTLDARSRFEAGARAVLHGWPRRVPEAH